MLNPGYFLSVFWERRSQNWEQTKSVWERAPAKTVGLPEEHLEFFYEHRNNFQIEFPNWEVKKEQKLHCTGNRGFCKFCADLSRGGLVDHMKAIDNHGEFQ